jgi:hypothetical protein
VKAILARAAGDGAGAAALAEILGRGSFAVRMAGVAGTDGTSA